MKIPIYSWEQIPDNEKVLGNDSWDYVVHRELEGGGLRGFTYLIEDKDIYIGKWYRPKRTFVVKAQKTYVVEHTSEFFAKEELWDRIKNTTPNLSYYIDGELQPKF